MLLINSNRNRGMAGDKLLDGVTERETWRRQGSSVGYQEHGQTALLGKRMCYGVDWVGLCGCGLWTVNCGGREKVGKSERGEKGDGVPISAKLSSSFSLRSFLALTVHVYLAGRTLPSSRRSPATTPSSARTVI